MFNTKDTEVFCFLQTRLRDFLINVKNFYSHFVSNGVFIYMFIYYSNSLTEYLVKLRYKVQQYSS